MVSSKPHDQSCRRCRHRATPCTFITVDKMQISSGGQKGSSQSSRTRHGSNTESRARVRRASGCIPTDLETGPSSSTTTHDVLQWDPISSDESASDPAVYWPNQQLPLFSGSSGQDLQQDWTVQPDYISLWNLDTWGSSVTQHCGSDLMSLNPQTTGCDEDADAYIVQWSQYHQAFGGQYSRQP